MRGDRPDSQVGENLLDHRGLLDEGVEPHWSRAPGADERIHLVDVLDEPCPGGLGREKKEAEP